MKLLENKTVLITGASRGIGKGIATVFAEHGANVVFTYSSSVDAANALETELQSTGVQAKGYQSNAADFEQAQELVENVLADFSTIDVLINNAGITKDNLLMRITEEDFDKVIEVNLNLFLTSPKPCSAHVETTARSIINMSSVVGVKESLDNQITQHLKRELLAFRSLLPLNLDRETSVAT